MAFLLAIALANDAVRDHGSLEEILAITPPEGEATTVIEWRSEKLDEPVFKDGRGRGKIEKAGTFGRNLAEVGHRAGYDQRITVHAARRQALTEVDCT